jgi:hypothetical protein
MRHLLIENCSSYLCHSGIFHLCIWFNIQDKSNFIHPCTHMSKHMCACHMHGWLCPRSFSPMTYIHAPTTTFSNFEFCIVWLNYPTLSCCTWLLPPSLHACHLPLVCPTMPTFCTCSPPFFHICFLFLTSRVYYGEGFWTCGPFAFGKVVGHVSIFHRFPPPRYLLYIDFQPPCGAYNGTV